MYKRLSNGNYVDVKFWEVIKSFMKELKGGDSDGSKRRNTTDNN